MSIRAALDIMLSKHSRTVLLERPDEEVIQVTIKVTPSNYSRNLQGPEETVMDGREFIVSKTNLEASGFPIPIKRGDRIVDEELGELTISQIVEMYDIGGAIMAYRCRTS